LGAVQVYAMERLIERHGLDAYSYVGGVSVGAINGLMFAANKLPELRALWNQVDGTDFFMRPNVFGKPGVFTLKPLRKKLKRNVRLSDIVPSLTYACGVVDYEADTYLNRAHQDMSDNDALWDAVCASAAQPIIMAGFKIEVAPALKHLCFDGGVKHVVPLLDDPASFDAIDVILCEPRHRLDPMPYSELNTLLKVASRSFRIMINENTLQADLVRIADWSDLTQVTVYAPDQHDDEWDASRETIQRRLNVTGRWMWEHPFDARVLLAARQGTP